MRLLPSLAVALGIVLAAPSLDRGTHAAPAQAADARTFAQSVVFVFGRLDNGNYINACGVVVPGGVLTCYHVIEGVAAVAVQGHDGKIVQASSWRRVRPTLDAAMIVLAEPAPWPALPIAKAMPPVASRAVVVSAWGRAYREGRRQGSWGYFYGPYAFLTGELPGCTEWVSGSIACRPGMSGAPLIVDGAVVALVSIARVGDETDLFAPVVGLSAIGAIPQGPRAPTPPPAKAAPT